MEYLEDANENDEELPAVFLEKTVPIKLTHKTEYSFPKGNEERKKIWTCHGSCAYSPFTQLF